LQSNDPVMHYKNDPNYHKYVSNIHASLRDYLLIYISSNVVIRKNDKKDYKLLFFNAFETGFLYGKSCMWNGELTSKLLTKATKPRRLPLMIKLTANIRRITEVSITSKTYLPNSIISEMLEERYQT